MGKLVTTGTGNEVLEGLPIEGMSFILEIMTRECRDLLDLLVDRHTELQGSTLEQRNQIIRDHFAGDLSGYGISVDEWLPGIDEAKRIEIIDKVLSSPEYTE